MKLDQRESKYLKQKETVLFPKGIYRRVHFNPMTLKAQWVSYYDGVLEMHQGWLEWDNTIQRYRFYFDDIDEEVRFIKTYKPIKKTYKDCSPNAIAKRCSWPENKEKKGRVWEE